MTDRPRSPSLSRSAILRSKSARRLALVAIVIGLSLAAAVDAGAQFRPTNPVGARPIGPGVNDPTGGRTLRLNTPQNEIDVPLTTIRPYGPVVIDNLDEYRQRLIAGRLRWTKWTKPPKQPKQFVVRGGFDAPTGDHVPNEVLLTIAPTVQIPTLDAVARQHRLARTESQDFTLTGRRLFRWRINDGRSVAAVIRTLATDVRVIAAQPNYFHYLQQEKPAEGKPTEAKPERPAPQTDSTQYAVAKLRLPQAHAMSRGDNIVVAVIDTAVDTAHPELAGVIAGTFDATGAAEKPQPHGTAMAGAIAAHAQLIGTAPAVKLLCIAAFGATRSEGTSFNILKGLEWAAKQNANIVNLSFAGPADPALQVMLAAARAKGIVLIAAAGNAGPRSRPLYPAADPNVIAVTATDPDDRLFDRANRGSHIAVAAPGVNILVAAPDGGYQTTSGTSVAAAEVSGVVALLLERNRKLDPAEVRRLLTSTARDLGPPGPDDQFGAGLVDAYAALTALGAKPTASAPRANGTP
jgi:subtilisin family serine protease